MAQADLATLDELEGFVEAEPGRRRGGRCGGRGGGGGGGGEPAERGDLLGVVCLDGVLGPDAALGVKLRPIDLGLGSGVGLGLGLP